MRSIVADSLLATLPTGTTMSLLFALRPTRHKARAESLTR